MYVTVHCIASVTLPCRLSVEKLQLLLGLNVGYSAFSNIALINKQTIIINFAKYTALFILIM